MSAEFSGFLEIPERGWNPPLPGSNKVKAKLLSRLSYFSYLKIRSVTIQTHLGALVSVQIQHTQQYAHCLSICMHTKTSSYTLPLMKARYLVSSGKGFESTRV